MMLTDLATVLRSAGLDVVECDGWKSRGHGQMSSVKGITVHHTASGRGTGKTLGLSTVRDGRPGLDGPLAQLYLNRAGTFYVVAAGLCWHAGASQQTSQTNTYRIGIECLAAGDGWSEDWPPEQMNALTLGCRALADHYRTGVSEVLGHKETCRPHGRKIDPSFRISMDAFRQTIRNIVPGQTGTTAMSSDFQSQHKLTAADVRAYGQASLKVGMTKSYDELTRFPPSVERARREAREDTAALAKQVAAIKAGQAAILDAIHGIAAGSPDAVTRAFDAGRAALAQDLAAIELRVTLADPDQD